MLQNWLNTIGTKGLSRNTLKRTTSLISAIFKLAKQQGCFHGENPVKDTATNPEAAEPEETYAYLEEMNSILAHIPETEALESEVADVLKKLEDDAEKE